MITLQASCKINLSLKITGLRPNGYHELDSFFYPLSHPTDRLEILPSEQQGLTLLTESAAILPANNTLTKCYDALAKVVGAENLPNIFVHLHKVIPIGAGLGGGSSDAACLLRHLNNCLTTPLKHPQLVQVAKEIGADVPFFLGKSAAHVQGIGEIITQGAIDLSPYILVLCCPQNQHVDTAWAYAQFDKDNIRAVDGQSHPLTKQPLCLKFEPSNAPMQESSTFRCINDLESCVCAHCPQIRQVREAINAYDPLVCTMTGSGASFYALFAPNMAAKLPPLIQTLADCHCVVYAFPPATL